MANRRDSNKRLVGAFIHKANKEELKLDAAKKGVAVSDIIKAITAHYLSMDEHDQRLLVSSYINLPVKFQ
tara:strand:- start:760 stop:969 length:210 start_codon:yes stop_codon:yes gene_type:complete